MKKIIAVALVMIFALSFCTVIASAADAAEPAASSIDFSAIIAQLMEMLKKVDWQKLMTTFMNLAKQLMTILSSAGGQ
ncbi:MAG: hypothetical protein IKD72_08655 [Clostridia bacterium]|nr:hypothetical protein [Clostridia bacterium]